MTKSLILQLYQSNQTVFTAREIALTWREDNLTRLANKIKYYVNKGDLIKLRRGLYAKNKYNVQEAAIKIYKPAYLSFETVLASAGIIFQYYETIFVASYLSREITLTNSQKIVFHKLKNEVLLNPQGIEKKNNLPIASKERAFLDTIYLNPEYYFDNLSTINWDRCFELAKIYKNKRLMKNLHSYAKLGKT